ncbi:MAG: hypothetical protein IJZ01_01245 [Paraprevotella sp.]|nr:hypothetical protein [Paraprevotella sp.]
MTKQINNLIFAVGLVLITLNACDDGPIRKDAIGTTHTGYTAKLIGKISGIDTWNDYYQVVLAGFGNSEYAITQVLVRTNEKGDATAILSDIGNDIKTVELCVTNTLRKRIYSYKVEDVASVTNDTILIEVGEIDISMFTAIQEHIFTPHCMSCHGSGEQPAAGLYLTADKSYEDLVNRPSTTIKGIRVIPGDSAQSVLHGAITPGKRIGLRFDHEQIITSRDERRVIDEWINNLRKND